MRKPPYSTTTENIIEIVTIVTGVNKTFIIQQNKLRKITDARKIAMHLMREYTDLSYADLSLYFQRDKRGIMKAYKSTVGLMDVDPAFKVLVLQAKEQVEALGLTKVEIERKPWYAKKPLNKAA